jgi:hypothetical protein
MKTFYLRSDNFVLSLTIMIFFISAIWISSIEANPVHALLEQKQTTSIPGSLAVKITEPMKGQQLNIGKNLTVLGISTYNASSKCGVLVIVDGIKPYQKTTPIGQVGGNSYSRWSYTLTPPYNGTIREGTNKITAKLLCQAIPENLTKFYSINVTGVNQIAPNEQHLANNTTIVHILSNNSSQNLPVPKAYTSSESVSSDSSGHHHQSSLHHHHHKRSNRTNHSYEGGHGGENNGGGYGGENNGGGYGSGYPSYGGGFFGWPYP